MSNGNDGMMMVMSMMMSMAGCMLVIPVCIFVAVMVYRNYMSPATSGDTETLTSDPGGVADACVVFMNNTPTDNPNGKTERVCLGAEETSRKIDFKQEYKDLHDEISAVRVGKGLYVDLFEHKEYGGGYLRIDGDTLRADEIVDLTRKCITADGTGSCSTGKPSWNDNVSSVSIVKKTA